jgi:hypothetical protein
MATGHWSISLFGNLNFCERYFLSTADRSDPPLQSGVQNYREVHGFTRHYMYDGECRKCWLPQLVFHTIVVCPIQRHGRSSVSAARHPKIWCPWSTHTGTRGCTCQSLSVMTTGGRRGIWDIAMRCGHRRGEGFRGTRNILSRTLAKGSERTYVRLDLPPLPRVWGPLV